MFIEGRHKFNLVHVKKGLTCEILYIILRNFHGYWDSVEI